MTVSLENEVGQYYLGKAYFFGQRGLIEDTVKGIQLIKLAAKNGFEEATEFLSKADSEMLKGCLLRVEMSTLFYQLHLARHSQTSLKISISFNF